VDVSGHPGHPEPASGFGVLRFSWWWAGWPAGSVVAAVGVEGEVTEDLAGGGVDDADVEVGDEHDDAGSGVGAADGDVMEVAVDAQGDVAAGGDAVVSDPEVGVAAAVAGAGLGPGGVGDGRGAALWEGAVRSLTVVDVDEAVAEGLQFCDRRWLVGLGA
jgi:hypothetical protein